MLGLELVIYVPFALLSFLFVIRSEFCFIVFDQSFRNFKKE